MRVCGGGVAAVGGHGLQCAAGTRVCADPLLHGCPWLVCAADGYLSSSSEEEEEEEEEEQAAGKME